MPVNDVPGMDASAIETFLDAAFGGKPDDHWFLLWTLPDRTSRWQSTVAGAVTEAKKLTDFDTYVSVALSRKRRAKDERGKYEDTAGIVGLWADIDIADEEAHKKPNLPPDEDAARSIVKACGLEPSVLVHSGHGLQAWWLFEEPWLFDSEAERAEAQQLALQWNATLRMHCAENGWVIDSTHDLTRVLRLPGSVNHKTAPTPARLLELGPLRHEPSAFEAYLADPSALSFITGRRTYHVPSGVVLDRGASLDFERVESLLDAVGNAARSTWDGKRNDLKDRSPSSFDMAMANYAVQCGWSDQEIVDLLVMRRRKAGDEIKRLDYFTRTISKARDAWARQESFEDLEAGDDELERAKLMRTVNTEDPTMTDMPSSDETHARRAQFDRIATQIGIEIVTIERQLTDPIGYRLVTPIGAVIIERARDLLDMRAMAGHVLAAAKHVMPKFKQEQWDKIAQAIVNAAVDVSLGDEATNAGLARAWLLSYLSDRPLEPDFDAAAEAGAPHRSEDNRVFIPTERMMRWLRMHSGERVNAARFGVVMRSFGCSAQRIDYRKESGKRTQVSGWWLPTAFSDDL